jgi:hypothetical protein
MSWVDTADVDNFDQYLERDPGIDVVTRPLVHMSPHDVSVQNITLPNDQPFLFAVLIRDQIRSQSEDADSFFAAVQSTMDDPILMVFASRDESMVGRCTTVQRVGACIAVTLVHSSITFDDIADYANIHAMERFSALHRNLRSLLMDGHPDDRSTFQDAISDCGMLAAFKTQLHMTRWMPEIDARRTGGAGGEPPNLCALFADARGPVQHISDVPDGVRCAATLMGGLVAIVCRDADDVDHGRVCHDFVTSLGARVIFSVSQRKEVVIDKLNSAGLSYLYKRNAHESYSPCVGVCGVSMMHIARVIGPACDLANACRDNFNNSGASCHDELDRLLEDACDGRAQELVEMHRQELVDARAVFARVIDRNLERIKARLWRPNGRLATTLIGGWSESC